MDSKIVALVLVTWIAKFWGASGEFSLRVACYVFGVYFPGVVIGVCLGSVRIIYV